MAEVKKDEEKKDEETLFDAMHSFIDFRYLVLGQKLKAIDNDSEEKIIFDDFVLSEIISEMKGN